MVPSKDGHNYRSNQKENILKDINRLMKGKKQLRNTSSYFKFLGLIDLGDSTDNALKELLTKAESLELFNNLSSKESLNKKKVYVKKIKCQI